MDKYLSKAKSKLQDKLQPFLNDSSDSQHHRHGPPPIPPKPLIPLTSQQTDRPSSITRVTPLDVLRYRYQHGANLGSIYVLEKWLFPGMFPGSCSGHGKSSELAAVKANVEELGMDGAREKFERHWANAVTDADLDWLVGKAKCEFLSITRCLSSAANLHLRATNLMHPIFFTFFISFSVPTMTYMQRRPPR